LIVNYYLLSLGAHLSRFRRWRTGTDRPHTRQQDVQGRRNTDASAEETKGEKKRSEEESVCLLDWRGATFFSRGSPEGEWRFFSMPDRRGISYSVVAVRTTHITYTPWMMCGKKPIHWRSPKHRIVSITTGMSQHATHYIASLCEFSKDDCMRDQPID